MRQENIERKDCDKKNSLRRNLLLITDNEVENESEYDENCQSDKIEKNNSKLDNDQETEQEYAIIYASDVFMDNSDKKKTFLARLDSKKGIIAIFALSVFIHIIFFNIVEHKREKYNVSKKLITINQPPKLEKSKQKSKKKQIAKTKAKPRSKSFKKKKNFKRKLKTKKSKLQLSAVGRKYIGKVESGSFPQLSLSYNDPFKYITEMYRLNAKTLVFNKLTEEIYEFNLFNNEIKGINKASFNGFSCLKRVIDDSCWESNKREAAISLGILEDDLDVLLLIPMSLELLWLGHQVNILKKMNIKISEVESMEAIFNRSKFKLLRICLKDGSKIAVKDVYGV